MRLAVSLPLLCLLAALFARPADATGLAFVVNSRSASVSLIDMTKLVELRRVPVLREPHHLVLSPDGKHLLVGDTIGNAIFFLDPNTGEVTQRLAVADPYQLGFSPNGKWLVVNGLARDQVDVYDAASMKLVRRFPIASMPSHLAFSPDSNMVYISLQGSNRLAAIDLTRLAVIWDVPVGSTPAGVLWNRGHVLVADMGADYVAVVDPADGKVINRIHTGAGAHQLFASPDGKQVYVNNRAAGTITVLDAASLATLRTYRVPGGPDDLAFAPDGTIWITCRFIEKVAVLNPTTGALRTVEVGRQP
ncbi:MAG: beta-propeller fold lactonase family protein, partial [Nevskiales bacterium]